MSALVYHTGALGDFITTIPALRFWKNQTRTEKLSLLGKSTIGEFAKEIGLIDDVIDVDGARSAPLFSDDFSTQANELLAPFNTVILFATPDSPIIRNIRKGNIPSIYWQPPFPAATTKSHVLDYHLSLFADPQSLDPKAKQPRIIPSVASINKSFDILYDNCSPVAIHPGSGSRKKNWPFDRFLTLARALREKGIPPLWILGPAEGALAVPSDDIVVSNQPIGVCAALLSRCRAFVGNDSGMTHLAATVGCPTVAIFGPSNPLVWSPRGMQVHVIYKNIPCSPCHESLAADATCGIKCLTAISVEEVLNNIDF